MKQNCVTMKVHPQFKSKLKIEAEKNGENMIEFSQKLARDDEIWQSVNKKKFRGDFNLKF